MINILQNNHLLFLAGIGVLGLIIGSFLNVVIYRLPIMLEHQANEYLERKSPIKYKIFNLFVPKSHCPKCTATISWWQNIPLISYVLLNGKCNYCHNIIHWRYPIVELLSCLTAIVTAQYFGIDIKTIFLLILTWSLIVAVFIDIDQQILPDNITLPLIWLGLLINTKYIFTTPENAIIGAASGYIFLWLVAYIFKLVRKIDGMGHGDFKLLAIFGAWLGWQILPLILFVASFIGVIISMILVLSKRHKFNQPIPFGPYLATTGWLAFFVVSQIYELFNYNFF